MTPQSPFIDFANRHLAPLVDSILQTPTQEPTEKEYLQALGQAFTLLKAGESAKLIDAIRDRLDGEKTVSKLKHSLEMKYHYSIRVDGKHIFDIAIPAFGRVPVFARQRAIDLASDEKNIPAFIRATGRDFLTGVRLYNRGQWFVVHGLNMHQDTLLNNQRTELINYTKEYAKPTTQKIDYNGNTYEVINSSALKY